MGDDQIGEFKEAFNMFSKNATVIDKETLKSAMRELGLKPTDEEVTQMIKDADPSGSGKVTFNSFYSMMTEKISQIDSPNELRTAFECYDTAGKGFISQDQFRAIMAESHGYKFSDKEVREIIKLGEQEGANFNYEKFVSQMGQI